MTLLNQKRRKDQEEAKERESGDRSGGMEAAQIGERSWSMNCKDST